MKKLYDKNELSFALLMIVIYVVGTIFSEAVSAMIGINKLLPAVFHVTFTAVLLTWIRKQGLTKKYGLIRPEYPLKKAWFFWPLILIAGFGLLCGIEFRYSAFECALFMISMLCVGFLEEIIFRGFLFLGMAKNNTKEAIVVSSMTFGIGHIVNLLNGAPLLGTLMQIIFAVAVGFTLVLLFYKGGSLLPCIVFHSLNNAFSVIEKTNAEVAKSLNMSETSLEMALVAFFVALLAIYCVFCLKKLEPVREQDLS